LFLKPGQFRQNTRPVRRLLYDVPVSGAKEGVLSVCIVCPRVVRGGFYLVGGKNGIGVCPRVYRAVIFIAVTFYVVFLKFLRVKFNRVLYI
jgi:hypothetical protein